MSAGPNNHAEETCLTTTIEDICAHGHPTTDSEKKVSPKYNDERDNSTTPAIARNNDVEEHANHLASNHGNDNEEEDFPEGGLRAWLVVLGSFCAMSMVFGIVNSTAAFQDYFSSNQLRGYSSAQIGWIFSLNLFLVFFCGIHVGRIFDAYGPRLLVAVGSLMMVLSMMLLSFCTSEYTLVGSGRQPYLL